MTRTKALLTLLMAWALNWIVTHNQDPNPIFRHGDNQPAILIWFGTTNPSEDQIDSFYIKFMSWVDHVSNRMKDIIKGEITFKDAIFEKITEEVWL